MTRLEKILANEKHALEVNREMQDEHREGIVRQQRYLKDRQAEERELVDSIARLETLVGGAE